MNLSGALRTLVGRGGKELASDQEVPRKNGVSTSGAGLFTFFKPTCDPGLTGFEIGLFTGIGGGEGSPGLKVKWNGIWSSVLWNSFRIPLSVRAVHGITSDMVEMRVPNPSVVQQYYVRFRTILLSN